ncbi:hypothetical protein [uncultured Paludibaculum sp.]|uniref:hypothetical protein n=1 Tax=uncultured Paludibaculum sp. TaxID=1765020 RepID=UPI002AAADCED|nr:hypothetical protein [uncultured Paludibaculum sp.]
MIGETAVHLSVKKGYFKSLKQLALITDKVPAFYLTLPHVPKPNPSVTGSIPSVLQNSATTVEFTGLGLDQIKSVTFATKKVPIQASEDGTKLSVFLDPNICSTPGVKALAATTDSAGVIPLKIEVKAK